MRLRRRAAILLFLLVPLSASIAQAGAPAKVELSYARDPQGALRLTAAVTDAAGAPAAGASVTFRARTAFGWLMLAEAETGKDGRVTVALPLDQRFPEIAAVAGDTQDVQASLALPPLERRPPAVRPGREILRTLSPQPGLISPYPPVQILLVGALLAGVWATYGYVLLLLTRLRAAR